MRPQYDTDFYAWAKYHAQLLRSGQLDGADWINIAEELDGMSKSEQRALRSTLKNLLLHLLKWQYQPSRQGNSWRKSIRHSRHKIALLLRDSPSLKPQIPLMLAEEYRHAQQDAADETRLAPETFPAHCPFSIAQILDEDFWPAT